MSTRIEAPGLTADWLNGWLAAVGAAVIVPGLRVSWSDDAVPWAVFESDEVGDIVEAVAAALPTPAALDSSVIARTHEGYADFPRKVTLETYRARAALERVTHSVHLAASVSDLRVDGDVTDLDHGAFDAAVPQGVTLWERAGSCAKAIPIEVRTEWLSASLHGPGHRVQFNGLGFDPRRLPASVQADGSGNEVFADPVVELLAFCALALFPTRGNGRRIRQRGWQRPATQRGAFRWSAWRPSLDRWAIDAFLDLDDPPAGTVLARYASVPYVARAKGTTRRAYFAEAQT